MLLEQVVPELLWNLLKSSQETPSVQHFYKHHLQSPNSPMPGSIHSWSKGFIYSLSSILGCLFACTWCLLATGAHVGCKTHLSRLWVIWTLSMYHLHAPNVFGATRQKYWKRCPVLPAQLSLFSNSLHFSRALEEGTRNTALDKLGIVNEWKNFLSYTAGGNVACILRQGCSDSAMAENSAHRGVIVIKHQGRLWPKVSAHIWV